MGKLTPFSLEALAMSGWHGEGDGLYLHISSSGSKSRVQRIVIDGGRRDPGLGSFPTVSLAQARSLASANPSEVSGTGPPFRKARSSGMEPKILRRASREGNNNYYGRHNRRGALRGQLQRHLLKIEEMSAGLGRRRPGLASNAKGSTGLLNAHFDLRGRID